MQHLFTDDRNDADLADLLSGMLKSPDADDHRQQCAAAATAIGPPMAGLMSSGLRL